MTGFREPGAMGTFDSAPKGSAPPHRVDGRPDDQKLFESAVAAMEAELANGGAHLIADSAAREVYTRHIKAIAEELRWEVNSGKITWAQAASKANQARNGIMEVIRGRSTPVGRAMAEQLKSEGRTLNELIARKVAQLYGPKANFNTLAAAEQNAVYAEIVASAAKSNPRVTATMRNLSRAGRGLMVISIAISVYHISTSENKIDAAKHEAAATGAGIGGGIAGGALAGLACGPGAPACVVVGAFVGGALAAFSVDFFW